MNTTVVYNKKSLVSGCSVVTVGRIVEALRTISDPEIPINICDLGLIYDISISAEGTVLIKMTLTTPACAAANVLLSDVARIIAALPGVGRVSVSLVLEPPWKSDYMSEVAKLVMDLD